MKSAYLRQAEGCATALCLSSALNGPDIRHSCFPPVRVSAGGLRPRAVEGKSRLDHRDISAGALIAAAADKFGVRDLEYTWVEKETARLAPRTHRAAADAAYWATFFSLLQLGQEELARRREATGTGIALSPTRWRG